MPSKDGPSHWKFRNAKAHFNEVFRRARLEGPQHITKKGHDGVVMLSEEQYERLVRRSQQPVSLVQFFRKSPLVGFDLNLDRDRDPAANTQL